MKKNLLEHIFSPSKDVRKILLFMKLTTLFIFLFCMQVSAKVYSQGNELTLNMDHVEISRALRMIEKKSEYRFLYNDALLSPGMMVNIHATDARVPDIVNHILSGTPLTYKLIGTHLIVIAAKSSKIQAVDVKGKVSDAAGNALLGVTIQVKGTTIGTVTGSSGEFSIDVPDSATLVVSYIGYETQEVPVNGQTTLSIVLQSSSAGLNEIVVIGYGTQKKSQVTGAISSVDASQLNNMPVMRVEQSLQGRTSGLTIAASSGQPGASSTVRIRGTTSINNSDPLYIVDGVPVDVGGIDYLNQNDIASIQVLKDAASAAIYGTRAANGVILITTKKGKAGNMQVNYSGYYGIQSPAKKLKLLNATQYATLRNESSVAAGNGMLFPDPKSLGAGTDWQNTIFNNSAKIQSHELSMSGGSEKSTYYASFGYYNQEGIVATPISHYKRFTVRLNTTHELKDWLRFGENIGYSYINNRGSLNTNSEFGGPLSSAINLDPITPVVITDPDVASQNPYSTQPVIRDQKGQPYGISSIVGQEMTNPLAYIQTQLGNYGWSHNIVGNAYVEVEPIPGLKIRSDIGAKLAFYGNVSFTPTYYLSPTNSHTSKPDYYRAMNQGLIWNWDNTISYSHNFGDHHLTFLVGTSAEKDAASGLNVTYRGLSVPDYHQASMNYTLPEGAYINNAVVVYRPGSGYENQPYALHSYFGRVIYDYQGKYLLTGILRVDGSTKFGSDNQYGKFPSVSVGWVPTKEDFWHPGDVINFLKIRASYGINGNDKSLSDFQFISTVSGSGRDYVFGPGTIYTGYSPNAPANPNLKWEQTSQLDVGFDADLFTDFNVTFDIYNKKTTGMLRQVRIPGYVGATGQPYGNVASLTDKGLELELGYKKQIGSFHLNVTGNASYVKNNITNIGLQSFITGANFQASAYEISRIQVGEPIGSFYGFKSLGIFQTQQQVDDYVNKAGQKIQPDAQPGDFIWADLNGDGQITADSDRTFLGDPTPHWTFGITAAVSWNNFELTAFGQGVSGNKIFQGLRRLDILTSNYTTAALGRWTGPGSSNTFPRLDDKDPNNNFLYPSAFYLSDGAYFRIKTVQLGYHIPGAITNRIGLDQLYVYISGNNLVTFTKYTGFDPEIGGSSYGIDRGVYPQARSFMFGLNVTF
jgi:TonB-linked SusC/RagA family outer membrane protein